MKAAFLQFDCRDDVRENELALALKEGAAACGDKLRIVRIALPFKQLTEPYELDAKLIDSIDADTIGMVSVRSEAWFKYCRKQGRNVLFFDKGYRNPLRKHHGTEKHGLWRIAVNAHQPVDYVASARHDLQRWTDLFAGERLYPWRSTGPQKHLVIANSAAAYSRWFDLPDPNQWVTEVVEDLQHYTDRTIYYRPRPGWGDAVPIHGTKFCQDESVEEVLHNAHAVVTYTSYISLDAMMYGVPSIVLGNAVMRSLSSVSLSDVESPRLANEEERYQLLANLAWCQYFIPEYANGFAWRSIRKLFT